MNERIKELAGQLSPVATIGNWGRVEWADNVYPQLADKMYAAVDLEKFAELIVRECLGCSNNLANHYIDNHSEKEQTLLLASIADYSNEIKKHFGVN
jgi:hypothetical protein